MMVFDDALLAITYVSNGSVESSQLPKLPIEQNCTSWPCQETKQKHHQICHNKHMGIRNTKKDKLTEIRKSGSDPRSKLSGNPSNALRLLPSVSFLSKERIESKTSWQCRDSSKFGWACDATSTAWDPISHHAGFSAPSNSLTSGISPSYINWHIRSTKLLLQNGLRITQKKNFSDTTTEMTNQSNVFTISIRLGYSFQDIEVSASVLHCLAIVNSKSYVECGKYWLGADFGQWSKVINAANFMHVSDLPRLARWDHSVQFHTDYYLCDMASGCLPWEFLDHSSQ